MKRRWSKVIGMSTLIEEIEAALPAMEPQRKAGFERLVRDALDLVKADTGSLLPGSAAVKYPPFEKGPWAGVPRDKKGFPEGYFAATAGCFENEPFERPEQLPDTIRETW